MMSLVALSTLGFVGYLFIGWVAAVVVSAMRVNKDGVREIPDGFGGYKKTTALHIKNKASMGWWWLVILWPLPLVIAVPAGLIFALVHFCKGVLSLSLVLGKKLNPKMEGWY